MGFISFVLYVMGSGGSNNNGDPTTTTTVVPGPLYCTQDFSDILGSSLLTIGETDQSKLLKVDKADCSEGSDPTNSTCDGWMKYVFGSASMSGYTLDAGFDETDLEVGISNTLTFTHSDADSKPVILRFAATQDDNQANEKIAIKNTSDENTDCANDGTNGVDCTVTITCPGTAATSESTSA